MNNNLIITIVVVFLAMVGLFAICNDDDGDPSGHVFVPAAGHHMA
jgi:hypothetical protein